MPLRANNIFSWKGDVNLGYYESEFETPFLELTREFFHNNAAKWNKQSDCFEYLNDANRAFLKEEENADFWLQVTTKDKMMAITIKEIVTDMAQLIVDKEAGVNNFFKNG